MVLFNTIFKLFLSKRNFPFRLKTFFLLAILLFLVWTLNSSNNKTRFSVNQLKQSFNDISFMQFAENFYAPINDNLKEKTTSNIYSTSTKETLKTTIQQNIDCNPLLTNSKQYSVLIDGVQYPTQVPLHKNVSINFKCLDQSSTKKIILFYNKWFGNEEFSIGIGYRTPFIRSGCPVTSCEAINDKNRINQSDFVVTHMADPIPELPSFRPTNQRWIFFLDVILIFF